GTCTGGPLRARSARAAASVVHRIAFRDLPCVAAPVANSFNAAPTETCLHECHRLLLSGAGPPVRSEAPADDDDDGDGQCPGAGRGAVCRSAAGPQPAAQRARCAVRAMERTAGATACRG